MANRIIRLLDLGVVPYLRSQTIYHAVARCLGDDTPDTIILLSPGEPYACIGYHQDLEQEIDLDYCRLHSLPVLRREVGGGTVYLDPQQLFYHCVFHQQRVPRRMDEAYRLFLHGPIQTYRHLGLAARLAAMNDIVVDERKIGGTGAGSIGLATVVCGSIIFDFDHHTMARLLHAPSPAFRTQVERQMRRYVTSLKGELGHEVPRDGVRDLLIAQFAQALGADIRPGELTLKEQADIEELDALFLSDEWLRAIRRPSPLVRQVKIRAGVLVCEAACELEGRRARLTLSLVDGFIDGAELTGDFGAGKVRGVELDLLGAPLATALADFSPRESVDSCLAMTQACLSSIRHAILNRH